MNAADLRRELVAIEDEWKAGVDARNRAFRDLWAAKMQDGTSPSEPPPVIRVTWSCGDPNAEPRPAQSAVR